MDTAHLSHIQEVLDGAVASQFLAGASCLVFQGGQERGFWQAGFADRENKVPFARETICRMYSMSKPITSVAAALLLQEGKIDLMEELDSYIPEFSRISYCDKKGKVKESPRQILLKDLMNMTSGLSYGGEENEGRKRISDLIRELDMKADRTDCMDTVEFASLLGFVPLDFIPGSSWEYGLSADVMGAVIEKASGMKFSDFLQKRMFAPLGMKDTAFYVPAEKQERLAKVYDCSDKKKGCILFTENRLGISNTMTRPPKFESGGAGLASTVDDYMKFCLMLLGRGSYGGARILSERAADFIGSGCLDRKQQKAFDITQPHLPGYSYANLMRVMKEPGRSLTISERGEFGWDGWLGTFMMVDRANELAVVLMMQRVDTGLSPVARKIKNIIYTAL
ncbi:MAG: beta-lactamase family protein [Treponema sp.]|nr:beta-lactamase family protein [Treponema sp.]